MKHGRKEQFSITIDTETADKFYAYQENNDILYKNMAMEQLLQKAFLYIDFMDTLDDKLYALFEASFNDVYNLVMKLAPKNLTLKKAVKVHYRNLENHFSDAKIKLDI